MIFTIAPFTDLHFFKPGLLSQSGPLGTRFRLYIMQYYCNLRVADL